MRFDSYTYIRIANHFYDFDIDYFIIEYFDLLHIFNSILYIISAGISFFYTKWNQQTDFYVKRNHSSSN